MQNTITKGSEIISLFISSRKSAIPFVINEDYCIVVQITAYSNGIVQGLKVWNAGNKTFYAKACYEGVSGVPLTTEIEIGAYTVFYRVGAFNSQGTDGFELKQENANKTSWICFVPQIKEV